MKVTKASLQAELDAVRKQHAEAIAKKESLLAETLNHLGEVRKELRYYEAKRDEAEKNAADYEQRIVAIQHCIETVLDVRHRTGVHPNGRWHDGMFVSEVADNTEEIRTLRHINKLASTKTN